MIVAAGLTPAWQQILVLDALQVGEVNRAREAHWCASGKVLNVGLALHELGAPSRTVSLVGGITGEAIRAEFASQGVAATWVESDTPTRVCTTILDRSSGRTTELVENAQPATPQELEPFVDAFSSAAASADVVVLSGSLPADTPVEFYRGLLETIDTSRVRALLDVRGPELLAALECRPFLVKPNREELAKTVGRELSDDADLLAAMWELNARGAEWVVVTGGGGPVLMTGGDDEAWSLRPPRVNVVNPIGCGDCLTAGIADALGGGADVVDAVRRGIRAAAANATQLLPARIAEIPPEIASATIAVERF